MRRAIVRVETLSVVAASATDTSFRSSIWFGMLGIYRSCPLRTRTDTELLHIVGIGILMVIRGHRLFAPTPQLQPGRPFLRQHGDHVGVAAPSVASAFRDRNEAQPLSLPDSVPGRGAADTGDGGDPVHEPIALPVALHFSGDDGEHGELALCEVDRD